MHVKQRPKVKDYGGLILIVLKKVFYAPTKSEITTGELLCFISQHFIVIVRHGEGSPLATVRLDLEADPETMALGPQAVLHAVRDRVIDGCVSIATALEQEVATQAPKACAGERKTRPQGSHVRTREVRD